MSNEGTPEYENPPARRNTDHGLLRASDADRDQVAQTLAAAYAEGRLSREEHDTRLDAAMRARTFSELTPLTWDLAVSPLGTPQPPATRPDGQGWRIDTVQANPNADTLIAFFGGSDRKGVWRARRAISDVVLFGGSTLDLRDAVFESNVCEITIFCMFGGVEIIVPDGVNVDNRVVAAFGGSDVRRLAPPSPSAPTVVLKGFVAFGGVDVKGVE